MSDLPVGWTWTDLAQICTSITDGDHQAPPQVPQGVPFLVIGNIRTHRLDFTSCRYVPKEYFESLSPIRRPQKGDVLYSLVGSYGIPVLVTDDTPFCVQRHIGILRPSPKINPSFLALVMSSRGAFDQATEYATGTAQLTVPLSGLRRIRIPLPPRLEQDRIVAAIEEQFSRLDAGVAAVGRVRQNLKRMRSAVLQAAVSGALVSVRGEKWETAALGDLLNDIHAGKSFKCAERPANPDEWGVVKVSAMTWGEFREQENKTVVGDRAVDPRFEIRPGDLLVSRANTVDYVGAVVLVRECRPRLLLSDKSLRLAPNSRVLPEWLLISLRSPSARRYIESVATGTSDSMRNISQPKLRALHVRLPTVGVQAKLVAEVGRMMSLIEQLEKSLQDSRRSEKALRASILASACSGKLLPQDSTDESASVLLQRVMADLATSNGQKPSQAHKPRAPREKVTG